MALRTTKARAVGRGKGQNGGIFPGGPEEAGMEEAEKDTPEKLAENSERGAMEAQERDLKRKTWSVASDTVSGQLR